MKEMKAASAASDQMEMFGWLVGQIFMEETELAIDRLLSAMEKEGGEEVNKDEADARPLTRTAAG